MWIRYNSNPLAANAEDCAIRAVSVALNVPWDEAFDMVAHMAKSMALMPHNNAAFRPRRDSFFAVSSLHYLVPATLISALILPKMAEVSTH